MSFLICCPFSFCLHLPYQFVWSVHTEGSDALSHLSRHCLHCPQICDSVKGTLFTRELRCEHNRATLQEQSWPRIPLKLSCEKGGPNAPLGNCESWHQGYWVVSSRRERGWGHPGLPLNGLWGCQRAGTLTVPPPVTGTCRVVLQNKPLERNIQNLLVSKHLLWSTLGLFHEKYLKTVYFYKSMDQWTLPWHADLKLTKEHSIIFSSNILEIKIEKKKNHVNSRKLTCWTPSILFSFFLQS